jgi:hypothetical protein
LIVKGRINSGSLPPIQYKEFCLTISRIDLKTKTNNLIGSFVLVKILTFTVFQIQVLRRRSGLKKEYLTGGWKQLGLHIEELQFVIVNIIIALKQRRTKEV